ncbi:unnamed protein product [Didymodactylos carnosus]|uniref:Uncharacterized protein n=1 Tax=Didymodactylos carnosus TaxID=1234261 RepID=A0A814IES1_9BILA|nr:unnamed protein product [Didymodactylos carnosus]CAF1635257.1 unnamed protein product [Didymodactylos carnosus]CAF3794357.1 unnamed protein product [Didymodactylos carnosus]CAF4465618.1 unnamed protein product [Didymodactylos carnosus]
MSSRKPKPNLEDPIGYGPGQIHLGKEQTSSSEKKRAPQAGEKGEEDSYVCGQASREIFGGTSSTRILGEPISKQLDDANLIDINSKKN